MLVGDEGLNNLVGSLGNDLLIGGTQEDTLEGGTGNDILVGSHGGDELTGGVGNDELFLGENDSATDTVIYEFADGQDTVFHFERGLGGDKIDFRFPVIFNDQLQGLEIDVITVGSDTEFRRTDDYFGQGELLITVKDIADFSYSDVGVNLIGSVIYNFEIIGSENNDLLKGTEDNDYLKGKEGNDLLEGDAGDDILLGGSGQDILTGGNGEDIFQFTDIDDSGDTITDFEVGIDKLDFTNLGVSSLDDFFITQNDNQTVITAKESDFSLLLNNNIPLTSLDVIWSAI